MPKIPRIQKCKTCRHDYDDHMYRGQCSKCYCSRYTTAKMMLDLRADQKRWQDVLRRVT